jgi:hypothetical protein
MSASTIPARAIHLRIRPILVVLFLAGGCVYAQNPSPAGAPSSSTAKSSDPSNVARGKKLVLKDGTYQIVREYQRNGDHVRYFSEERGEWEEIPASMIDWDATAKDQAETEKMAAAEVAKLHRQEEVKRMDNVSDIDASLQVGQGAFLPSGEGLFVVEGKTVRLLTQAGSRTKTDTLRTIEQVMSPVPIVPGKKNVVLEGTRATLRLRTTTPEFYLREPPPDPDRVSPILKSSRPGESGPDLVLLRAKVIRNGRQLEAINTLMGQTISKTMDEISVQRWEVAPAVYRFTLSQALTPGEYVLAEVLEDGLNYYVWDFGLDGAEDTGRKKK